MGKQKYIYLKRVCKSDGVVFAKYKDVYKFRSDITLDKEFIFIRNSSEVSIGIGVSYTSIMRQTVTRLLQTISPFVDSQLLRPMVWTALDPIKYTTSSKRLQSLIAKVLFYLPSNPSLFMIVTMRYYGTIKHRIPNLR